MKNYYKDLTKLHNKRIALEIDMEIIRTDIREAALSLCGGSMSLMADKMQVDYSRIWRGYRGHSVLTMSIYKMMGEIIEGKR